MIYLGFTPVKRENRMIVYKRMVIKAGGKMMVNGKESHSVAIIAHKGSPFIYTADGNLAEVFDKAKKIIDGMLVRR